MLSLVTGNQSKFQSAQQRLQPMGIELQMHAMNLVEPQEESIEQVVRFKLNQAYQTIQGPVLVSDTGWSIPSLNGFPGPYMHFLADWFTVEDWLNLIRDKSDTTIAMENIVAYQDGETIQLFPSKRTGTFVLEPQGTGLSIDRVVTFRHDRKTIAQCMAEGIASHDHDQEASPWSQFGAWYLQSK